MVTCTLDKQCDRLILKYHWAISSQRIEYSLAEIRDVLIESRSWDGDIPLDFQIVLFFKNGIFLALDGVSSSPDWGFPITKKVVTGYILNSESNLLES